VHPHPIARKEKVIEALKFLQKNRDLRLFDKRREIVQTVRYLALDHSALSELQP
jgi:hypothetical protein